MTWQEVLGKIREAKESIPVEEDGLPLNARQLLLYELLQLLEATTCGYNKQIQKIKRLEAENARLKKVLAKAFPNGGK